MTERTAFVLGATATATLAMYGSLVPFRWREAPGTPWERVNSLPLAPLAVTWSGDLVVNVAVMLPVGFFALAAVSSGRRVERLRVVIVATALSAFALTLEVAQLFVRDRTASWSDVAGLSAGGIAGILLWIAVGPPLVDQVKRVRHGAFASRLHALTLLYTAAWIGASLLPLLFPKYAYPLVRSVWMRTTPTQTVWATAAERGLDAASVAPIGAALALTALRGGLRASAAALLAVIGLAGVSALDAIEQVAPLIGRPSSASRLVGLALGAMAGLRLARHRLARPAAGWCSATWAAMTIVVAWAPFDFGVSPEQLDQRIRVLYERAPLSRYYWAPPLLALDMAATMILQGLAAGGLLRLAIGVRRASTEVWIVLGVALIFSGLEWGQLYLPARRADPTDVGLATLGAFIGVRLSSWLAASPPRPPADN